MILKAGVWRKILICIFYTVNSLMGWGIAAGPGGGIVLKGRKRENIFTSFPYHFHAGVFENKFHITPLSF